MLAATNVLDVVVAGVSVTRLLAVDLLFGGLVALAPLAVLAFGGSPGGARKPNLFSFAVGCFLTSWAGQGQVLALGSLLAAARADGLAAVLLWSLVVVASAVLGVYVLRSVWEQGTEPPPAAQLPPRPYGQVPPGAAVRTRLAALGKVD